VYLSGDVSGEEPPPAITSRAPPINRTIQGGGLGQRSESRYTCSVVGGIGCIYLAVL